MIKKESEILSHLSKDSGFKVPDNYFVDFADKISKSLPECKIEPQKKPTAWQHVRPWVYMAAMFAGIWCMMNVFTRMRDNNPDYNPAMAEAFSNESFVDDFVLTKDFDEFDLIQQMYEDSVNISEELADTIK